MKISQRTRHQLQAAIKEDVGSGDKTARLMVPASAEASSSVFAREAGIFCGEAVVIELAKQFKIKIKWQIKDAKRFKKNQIIFQVFGNLRALLAFERTMLNLVGHISGIATLTDQFVLQTKKYHVQILDTRKTTPLWRELEKYAVRVGGGKNHRMGLYDEVFVKENHKAFGQIKNLKKIPRKFVIEVRNLKELNEALPFKPRVILFDNYSPKALKRAVHGVRAKDPHVLLEASGGINLKNVKRYAATGIDQISVGALTHSVKSINFSMIIE